MSRIAKFPDVELVNNSADNATTIEPPQNIVLDPVHAPTEDTEWVSN